MLVLAVASSRSSARPGGGLAAATRVVPTAALTGRVTRVVDGDTVHVRIGGSDERVRYIGVDTPETVKPGTPVQCFGKAASAYNHRLVDGQRCGCASTPSGTTATAACSPTSTARRDGLFVNAALVRGGYATTLTIAPNTAHATQFAALERRARDRRRGLWRACPTG